MSNLKSYTQTRINSCRLGDNNCTQKALHYVHIEIKSS